MTESDKPRKTGVHWKLLFFSLFWVWPLSLIPGSVWMDVAATHMEAKVTTQTEGPDWNERGPGADEVPDVQSQRWKLWRPPAQDRSHDESSEPRAFAEQVVATGKVQGQLEETTVLLENNLLDLEVHPTPKLEFAMETPRTWLSNSVVKVSFLFPDALTELTTKNGHRFPPEEWDPNTDWDSPKTHRQPTGACSSEHCVKLESSPWLPGPRFLLSVDLDVPNNTLTYVFAPQYRCHLITRNLSITRPISGRKEADRRCTSVDFDFHHGASVLRAEAERISAVVALILCLLVLLARRPLFSRKYITGRRETVQWVLAAPGILCCCAFVLALYMWFAFLTSGSGSSERVIRVRRGETIHLDTPSGRFRMIFD